MPEVKKKVGSVVNNKYNKTAYTAIVGAGLTVVYILLNDYGIDVSPALQGATTTFAMMLTTLFVKNKS